jgi:tetratricopeptide (TPR) repeat protein
MHSQLRAICFAGWLSLLGIWVAVSVAGCATLRRNKAADPVLTSRQLSLRGVDAMHRGRWDDAESLFRSAIEAHPADERAHRQYAEVLWRRGHRDEAISQLEEAVRLSGGDPEMRVQLGEMYLDRGDVHQAWGQSEQALASHRQLPSAWALRGDLLRCMGQLDEALTSYHRALSYEPRYPRVQIAVAEIYRNQDRPQRALATLQLLIEQYGTDPPPADVWMLQGLAFKALGRYDQAIESFAQAKQTGQPNGDLLFHLAETHWLAGDVANARLALQAALECHPEHSPSKQLQAEMLAGSHHLTAGLDTQVR